MRITWIGHACFLIETEGKRILTDPFDESVPYDLPAMSADLVTVSHGHSDHNAVRRIGGNPAMIQGTGNLRVRGVSLRGIPACHDDEDGTVRGENILYVFDLEGVLVAHLGDLGAPLNSEQRQELAATSVVLCPVGGTYTIDAAQAAALASQLPALKVFIPMHFKTDRIPDWPIETVEPFEKMMDNVCRIGDSAVSVTRDTLPDSLEVWILDHA